jgi:serine/threonine protein kinase
MEGVIIGTPAYMSPEQASGKPADFRVDIYAVGVVMYEMLVGAPPFDGDAFGQLVVKIVTQQPPPIAAKTVSGEPIPDGLKALIMKCLEKDPTKRPQSMSEIADALLPFAGGEASVGRRASTAPKKSWGWAAAGLALALVLGAGGWVFVERDSFFPQSVQAATPPPAPTPPEPPKPTRIALVVHSVPSGARVLRPDTGETLGSTPLQIEMAPAKELPLRLELSGYETIDRQIELLKDKDEDFNLLPKKQAEVTRKPGPLKKKEKVTKDGVIDPFAN